MKILRPDLGLNRTVESVETEVDRREAVEFVLENDEAAEDMTAGNAPMDLAYARDDTFEQDMDPTLSALQQILLHEAEEQNWF